MMKYNLYQELIQPPLSPPAWVFTPVWALLYITILVSLILYIIKPTAQNKMSGYLWFGYQLLLNILWTPAFFILKNLWLALIIIIMLDIAVFFTIKNFYSISKIAARLLIPYFIWILFATYLNAAFVILN